MRCVVPSFAPSSVGSFSRVRVAPRAQTDTNSSGDLSFSCAGKSALSAALPVVSSSSDSLAARPGLSACVCACGHACAWRVCAPRRLRFSAGRGTPPRRTTFSPLRWLSVGWPGPCAAAPPPPVVSPAPLISPPRLLCAPARRCASRDDDHASSAILRSLCQELTFRTGALRAAQRRRSPSVLQLPCSICSLPPAGNECIYLAGFETECVVVDCSGASASAPCHTVCRASLDCGVVSSSAGMPSSSA